MTQPIRIQRTRRTIINPETDTLQARSLAANGLPAVCVTRPGKYGNPFKVGMWFRKLSNDWRMWSCGDKPFGDQQVRDLEHSLELFEQYATARLLWDKKWLEPLRGVNLSCWCALDSKCHADVLLRLSNE